MTTSKSYDYLNRLSAISSSAGGSNVAVFHYANNAANQRTSITNLDNTRWVYQYDALGQVISGKKYWSDGTPVAGQQFEYAFDDIGNRRSTKAGGDNSGANLRPASYLNNSLNQILSREVPGYVNVLGTASNNATVTLWGDNGSYSMTSRKGEYFRGELPVNNATGAVWLTVTNVAVLNNGANPDIVTNTVGRTFLPKTAETFAYDADGNLTNDGRWTFTWDAENRLIRLVAATATGPQQRIDFAYDWQGRRIGKKGWDNPAGTGNPVVDERFVYDGWNVIAVLNPQSSILKSFMWGLDLSGTQQGAGGVGGLVKVYDQSANKHYFPGYDGNGNVVLLVNGDTGEEAARYEYGPFGETIRMTGLVAKANPFRFSTKFQDDETDLLYYGYRYYDPSTGRWLNRDPIGELGGINLYQFVYNSPLNYVDPDGRTGWALNNPARWGNPSAPDFNPNYPGPTMEDLHTALDAAGLIDPTPISDGINAGLYGLEGDFGNAGVSMAGMLPYLGDAAKLGKYGKKACDAAQSAKAAADLKRKLKALEDAQKRAVQTRKLPDGRVRYYEAEVPATNPGPTRGAAYVTEHNPATGQVRSWVESYDQAGNVTRVHPKMVDGQVVDLPHYPPTGRELGR